MTLQISAERLVATGVLYSLPLESQERIKQTVANLKKVISEVSQEEGLVAYMVFSCDLMDAAKK